MEMGGARRFQLRLQRASLKVIFTYYAVAFGFLQAVGFGFFSAVNTRRSLIVGGVEGLLFACLMTSFAAAGRRRDIARTGSVQATALLDEAIRKGYMPTEPAERAALAGLIVRRQLQLNRTRWMNPLVFGLATLLAVVLTTEGPLWPDGLLIPTFIGFGVWVGWLVSRSQRRLDQAQQQLGGYEEGV